ncbi:MAG: hypothetical protein R3194_13935, partial [Limnobacter sp.]|nr:hypothetical protein [Limnobacter sp.]
MKSRQAKHTFLEHSMRHLGLMLLSVWLCVFASQALAQTEVSDRFVLKLHDAVELSSSPSVRRLEIEGDRIREVLNRNGVDATWLRAGSLGSHVLQWAPSVRPQDRQALINRLSSDPDVQYVFEDEIVQPMVSP